MWYGYWLQPWHPWGEWCISKAVKWSVDAFSCIHVVRKIQQIKTKESKSWTVVSLLDQPTSARRWALGKLLKGKVRGAFCYHVCCQHSKYFRWCGSSSGNVFSCSSSIFGASLTNYWEWERYSSKYCAKEPVDTPRFSWNFDTGVQLELFRQQRYPIQLRWNPDSPQRSTGPWRLRMKLT